MSYSGQSNPPWQRNTLGSAGQSNMQNLQNPMAMSNTGMHYQNQQPMYNQSIGMQQSAQNQNVSYSSLSGNMNQMPSAPAPLFSQAVSYPNARGLNPIAFPSNTNQSQTPTGPTQTQNSNYNAIGTVTKMHNDCGFVDDEVFFHKNVCKGSPPKIGDKVLVEATFNPNSPFKWNATRIQIVAAPNNNMQPRAPPPPLMGGSNSKGSGYNAVPPPNEYANQFGRGQNSRRISPPRRSPDRHTKRDSRHRDEEEMDRKRRRDERERERHREKREHSVEKRERSPVRRSSPKRRRTRAIPRYMVQIPKISLTMSEADVLELRRRYTNLYVPSDFFFTQIQWSKSFSPNNPFSIKRPCTFHIMHKTVEQPKETVKSLDPPDANYLFSAKVMLMGVPPISEIYQKCLLDDKEHDDDRDFVHPTRLINFLVGVRGKNETMAIGGPWSRSLDGDDPQGDPTVLIKTAIRSCNYLTGIDLSGCTQWYRFVELYYRRPETTHKGRLIPARVETVVIFLPDINSCMPTRTEWDGLQRNYKTSLERVLNQDNCSNTTGTNSGGLSSASITGGIVISGNDGDVSADNNGSSGLDIENTKILSTASTATDETGNEKGDIGVKVEPTHYSLIDPRNMKIQDLRDELNARNLSAKGLKPQLIARLSKIINTERQQDENKDDEVGDKEEEEDNKSGQDDNEENDNLDDGAEVDMTDIVVLDEYDSTKPEDNKTKKETSKIMDTKERQQLERRYKLPDQPHIIIHPSKTAKGGRFDCTVMSLSLLLDYRPEDTKEHSFEVSLFAELFNEMLMRDFGFNIYKEVALLPDKIREGDINKKKDEITNSTEKENEKTKDTDEKRDTNEISEKSRERCISESEKSDKKISKDRKSAKRSYDDDTEDDDYSIKSGDRRKKQKLVIAKHELLLSFIYFDTTHCGYIFEKDVEDLFYIIGLNLSRAQVRKLLGKIISRDALYYRKLTDKPKEDEASSGTTINEKNDEQQNELDGQLAKGNKSLLPIFKETTSRDTEPTKQNSTNSSNDVSNNNCEGMISYNGGLVDVGKLVEQMKRSERAREEIEQILIDLRKQNTELQASSTKANSKIKVLQADVKSLSRKLSDSEQSVSSFNRRNNEYYSVLASIYDRVSPIFSKPDRSSKSDSGRHKDKEREKEKDKEKEKDNDKDKDHEKEKDHDKEKEHDNEKDKEKEDSKDIVKVDVKKEEESKVEETKK